MLLSLDLLDALIVIIYFSCIVVNALFGDLSVCSLYGRRRMICLGLFTIDYLCLLLDCLLVILRCECLYFALFT